jgi:myo-inositol 2-dehydrogenase/D-chiro-inositol 1-dehydrogenase
MSALKTIRVGVIGAGRIGKIHAENIATRIPGAVVVAIADPNVAFAKELAEKLHVDTYYEDYRKIMEDKSIDAVAICSSTDTHSKFMIEAAEAGKHIFCEKPVDLSLEKIDAALSAVKKAGVKCQIGFNRRFDPNFKKVRQFVADGKVGDVHILRITSRDPSAPPVSYVKVSGGMFMDMTIHDFDMARYLSGSEVVEVYAAGGVMVDPEIGKAGDIDTAVITLKFANGAIGTIDNSRKADYGYDQRVEVFGSKGMVAVANNTANSSVFSSAEGVVSEKPLHFFLERYMDSFIA